MAAIRQLADKFLKFCMNSPTSNQPPVLPHIGFVPAERCIVTTGIYAYVRHPIYSGLFISIVAVDIASFSWRNIALDITWVSLWIIKTFAEEHFLRTSDEYAQYMMRVRWRWFPAIA
jgi:protein-S-isoprenylcysteine O-methyltransferase Ste14